MQVALGKTVFHSLKALLAGGAYVPTVFVGMYPPQLGVQSPRVRVETLLQPKSSAFSPGHIPNAAPEPTCYCRRAVEFALLMI